ncbi:MAG: malate dehydrogenase (quinone) [Verrucomicrobia bacterium]|nr:MAG: malate dehydrogenase (quinone) [Verrucomicrobiota bacterium]TAE89193.1 MAG: malate dehydrogenase (quinone) [Verrucomicrobiota bacterium]TAF27931.1 MAG: malate dehydrogenase (quinone) [Verrucomicrobiota bacterium]TAF42780.1 MAG: malate dehydrogenase (quinone) [Verrucomicrobiota bacterium]
MPHFSHIENPDVILIGSGVMSSNLGAMLKRLEPSLTIQVYEVTDGLSQESSDGWNNAGTGHAGICELSYTPHREKDGSVNVAKAIQIFEQFEHSKQFWSYAVDSGMVDNPREFINPVAHLSFVHGQEQVDYLKARYDGMSAHHFFRDMEYSTDRTTIGSWAPLLVEGRKDIPIAATKMDGGTDVNFGNISRKLLGWLDQQPGCGIASNHRVIDLTKTEHGWEVRVKDLRTGEVHENHAKFVFVGAGGGSLTLLQKSGIPEAKGLGGFPIGGQWLICENPEIVAKHQAKVYGQPLESAPTMAVPHLDTRILDGKKTLLFGPFAAWTTKFLHKKGSYLDLPLSVKPDNLATLLKIGASNLPLVQYLVQQGTQSMADRMEVLHVFYPDAKAEDWKLIDAGIRVQAIKKTDGEAGIVHYGTEVITNADRSISALLGASPGASVSVNIVLDVVKLCFPDLLATPEGQARMSEMIPTWNEDIKRPEAAARFHEVSQRADRILGLA